MSDTQPPSIVDPVESQRLQAAYEEYMKERARPWRLIGRYEEAISQIGDVLDMKLSATAKLAMVRERVELAKNIEKGSSTNDHRTSRLPPRHAHSPLGR